MSRIRQLIDRVTPKMNPVIADGVAYHQTKFALDYLKSAMRSAAKSFPEGLIFDDCSYCTPIEEYDRIVSRNQNRRNYDVAISHLTMIKFEFTYKGKKLNPIYVNIPFVGEAGLLMINNTEYMISPTLNDIVFSVTVDSIFVRLLRDRMRFQRFTHRYETLQGKAELASVIWCPIHKGRDTSPYVRINTNNVHYLLAKYGFTETFKRFAGFVPVVGELEINEKTYPPEEWVICQSSMVTKPRILRSIEWFRPTIRLAIPKKHYDHMTKSLIGGFFYVLDHFPTRMKVEWLDSVRQWKILLGLCIFSGNKNEGELHENINNHIRSLDEYLDVFVINQLRDINIDATNLYEILALLIKNFTVWSSAGTDRITTLYGKELNVNYFLLFRITKHIFNSVFELAKKTDSRKVITADEIYSVLNRELTTNRIFKIVSDNEEVSVPQSPNDSKIFRLSSVMVPQSANESSPRSSRSINLNDPAHLLHASLIEVGGYNSMTKNHPDGRRRLNPYVQLDDKYRIVRREKFIPLIDWIQEMVKHT